MKQEYPKRIYNNKDAVDCTVESEAQHDLLKGYFKDELDHSKLPYKFIPVSEALRLHAEAKKEVLDDLENAEPEADKEVLDDLENAEPEADKEVLDDLENAEPEADKDELDELMEADLLGRSGKTPEEISALSWKDLRAYGKELELEHGVELPLSAKRDQIEIAINKVLNDDNSKRPS